MEVHPIFYIKSVIQDCLVFHIPHSLRGIAIHYNSDKESIQAQCYFYSTYTTHHTDVVAGALLEVEHEIDFIRKVEVDFSVKEEMIIKLAEGYQWVYFAHEDL